MNILGGGRLERFGLDVRNSADRTLLNQLITSPAPGEGLAVGGRSAVSERRPEGVPASNNQLTSQLRMFTPGNFGPVAEFNPWNYSRGSFFREGFDPDGDFDPRQYNPATPADPNVASYLAGGFGANNTCAVESCVWTDPAAGTWGTTAPYLEGYRWRRRPNESVNIGRNFRMGPEGRWVLNVRAEFTNIFNRMFYNAPASGNPTAPVTTFTQCGQIIPNGGYGVVNTLNGAGSQPRQGTIVARLTF